MVDKTERGPPIQNPGNAGNLIIELADDASAEGGGPIEAAGIEMSWRADYLDVWPANPDDYQATPVGVKKSEIEAISLCNEVTGTPATPYKLTLDT